MATPSFTQLQATNSNIKTALPVQSNAAAALAAHNESKSKSSSRSVSRKFAALRAGCFGSRKTPSRASSRTSQKSSPLLISSNGVVPAASKTHNNDVFAAVSGPNRTTTGALMDETPTANDDEHGDPSVRLKTSSVSRPVPGQDSALADHRRTQSSNTRFSAHAMLPAERPIEIVFPSQQREAQFSTTSVSPSVALRKHKLSYSKTSLVSIDDALPEKQPRQPGEKGELDGSHACDSTLTGCTLTQSTPVVETVDEVHSVVTTKTQFSRPLQQDGAQSISDCRTHHDRSSFPTEPVPAKEAAFVAEKVTFSMAATPAEVPPEPQRKTNQSLGPLQLMTQEKSAVMIPQTVSALVQPSAQMQLSVSDTDAEKRQPALLLTPNASIAPTSLSPLLSAAVPGSKSKEFSSPATSTVEVATTPSSRTVQKQPTPSKITQAGAKLKSSSSADSVVSHAIASPKSAGILKQHTTENNIKEVEKRPAGGQSSGTSAAVKAPKTTASPAKNDFRPSVEYISSFVPSPLSSPKSTLPTIAAPTSSAKEAAPPPTPTSVPPPLFPSLFSRVTASQRVSQFMPPVIGSLMNRRWQQQSTPNAAASSAEGPSTSSTSAPAAGQPTDEGPLASRTSTTAELSTGQGFSTSANFKAETSAVAGNTAQQALQRRASVTVSRDSFGLFAATEHISTAALITDGNNIPSNVTLPASHLTGFLPRSIAMDDQQQESRTNNIFDQQSPSAAFLLNPEGRPPGSILATDITTRLEGMRSAFASPLANMMSQAMLHDANAQQAFALHLYPPPKVRTIKNLPESVVELRHARSGSTVFVVPVQAFDEQSANIVEDTIKEVDPDIVFVQIGKHDIRALCDTESDDELLANESRCQWNKFTINCNNYGRLAGLAQTLHQVNLAASTRHCGVVEKHAYRAALQQAEALNFCDVIYGVRPELITMQRLYNTMSLMEKLVLVCRLCFARISNNSQRNFPTFAHFARARRIMIDECDKYTVAVLQYYSQAVLRTSVGRSPAVLVAITDQQHVAGIVRYWSRRIDLKALLEVPPRCRHEILIDNVVTVMPKVALVLVVSYLSLKLYYSPPNWSKRLNKRLGRTFVRALNEFRRRLPALGGDAVAPKLPTSNAYFIHTSN